MMKLRKTIVLFTFLASAFSLSSQEKLLSSTDSYFDYLALIGKTERPYLNFRTLSDSKWVLSDTTNHIWKQHADIEGYNKDKHLKLLNPESYFSYNGASPYGQNDGLLWQGRGLNAYLSAGVRYEKHGFEITFKPEIAFSSNREFEFMPPDSYYNTNLYTNKAAIYGYYGVRSIDAPQRFGENPFVKVGWGDSEIRYTNKTFTVGFGTQYLWLGAARLNPIIHSNNAPSYPKLDIGVRPTPIRLWGWFAGKVEARLWLGQLRESAYFDNDNTNNKRLISGLTAAFSPSFLKGLTLSANRNFMCRWETGSLMSIFDLFYIPGNIYGGRDTWDQRASVGFNYLLPASGIEVYVEIGLDDYSPGMDGYIRYPFHSMVHTTGLRKSVPVNFFGHALQGELLVEVSNLEMSQDYQFQYPATFYGHHQITHGYTNEGQWLGAGNGTGGNSQYIGFKTYHPKGRVNVFVHRQNPDNDHIYRFSVGTVNTESVNKNIRDFKAIMTIGVNSVYFIRRNLQLFGGISYIVEHNPLYNSISWEETSKRRSVRLETGLVYIL